MKFLKHHLLTLLFLASMYVSFPSKADASCFFAGQRCMFFFGNCGFGCDDLVWVFYCQNGVRYYFMGCCPLC